MSIEIEQVTDERGARALHQIGVETTPHDHPGLLPEPLDDILGMLPNPLPSFHVAFFLGREVGDAVAWGFLGLPTTENTHICHLYVDVALAARRRGIGAQMAAFLFDEARQANRRLALWNTGSPLDGTSAGDLMSTQLGAQAALTSIRRELSLADIVVEEIAQHLKELHDGPCSDYELRSWSGHCPDDLVEGAAEIVPLVMSDAPQGKLEMEHERWDVARYRDHESMLASRHRHLLATAAVERVTGNVVALTDLTVPHSEHRVADQLGTAVVPAHRGHRLGLAIKMANVLNLVGTFPDAERIQTHNAAENEHMIAVNTALGFRPVERSTTWQLDL